jgi:hypothetical protein
MLHSQQFYWKSPFVPIASFGSGQGWRKAVEVEGLSISAQLRNGAATE